MNTVCVWYIRLKPKERQGEKDSHDDKDRGEEVDSIRPRINNIWFPQTDRQCICSSTCFSCSSCFSSQPELNWPTNEPTERHAESHNQIMRLRVHSYTMQSSSRHAHFSSSSSSLSFSPRATEWPVRVTAIEIMCQVRSRTWGEILIIKRIFHSTPTACKCALQSELIKVCWSLNYAMVASSTNIQPSELSVALESFVIPWIKLNLCMRLVIACWHCFRQIWMPKWIILGAGITPGSEVQGFNIIKNLAKDLSLAQIQSPIYLWLPQTTESGWNWIYRQAVEKGRRCWQRLKLINLLKTSTLREGW